MIAIAVTNSQNKKDKKKNGGNSVWDQVDKGGSQFLKTFANSATRDQLNRGVRDLEDAINNMKRKGVQQAKRKEEASYQQEQEAWRKKQEEDRKRRDLEERRKKKLELQKKEAEQRRKALEREKREREEKALLEHCQLAQDKGCDVHNNLQEETLFGNPVWETEKKDDNLNKKQEHFTDGMGYRIEEYLDPLTSSFYPKVEEYLSPTTASFYPDIDVSVFSLQNETNVL